MIVITHKLWPVSYVSDSGSIINSLYSFKPHGEGYWVGEPIQLAVQHSEDIAETSRNARIAELKETLAKLEAA